MKVDMTGRNASKVYLRRINSLRPSDAYMCRKLTTVGSDNGLGGAKPLTKPVLEYF